MSDVFKLYEDYGYGPYRVARIIAIVSPDNAASIGLTEKLGLRFEKTARLPGEEKDVSLYSMSLQA